MCGRHRGGPGKPSFLTKEQVEQVVAEAAATGVFATAQAVRDWIEERFGVVYTRGSMYTLAAAGDPAEGAPAAPREDGPPGPGGLEKGGLGERLAKVGLKLGQGIVWGDEMRLGL